MQRVSCARVEVGGKVVGAIGAGLLVLLGVGSGDDAARAEALAAKVAKLRIFGDEAGKMNRSVRDVGGAALVISQFTLYADARRGNRPSYTDAAPPERAEKLYGHFVTALKGQGLEVATGVFGADMQVSLTNDGPVTLMLEL
ncbi:D-aminoacyl-tRNA deacylase [Truepera radiovictrix]|nr:D-aminoacyl-tRNA deacylase [Truepera radiovictrix]WMT57047.1 D-aminoacyl-tRNA deacylase [Truepera radiovictrix]